MEARGVWVALRRDPRYRWVMASGLALVGLLALTMPEFFHAIEARQGWTLADPVLELVGPRDVAAITFLALYSGILLGLGQLHARPHAAVRLLHAYGLLLILRMLAIYLVPLDPPPGIIPLADPITAFFYPHHQPFLKDLFFSGHTATLALLALTAERAAIRRLLWALAATVAALLLVQHVHYTVDVVLAPVFAWAAWRSARWAGQRAGVGR